MKITEYERVNTFREGDNLLIDGDGGPRLVPYPVIKNLITQPFDLAIDSNGNYGYIKRGADSVTPF